jgi:hypothetical protein
LPEDALKKYREAVANLPGFNPADVLSKGQPVTRFDSISEESISAFLNISLQLVDDWRSVPTVLETS